MADYLESASVVARVKRRSVIPLTVDTVLQIVERLRNPAAPGRGNPKSWRENRHIDDSITKARAYKNGLRKKGMTADDAEHEAAKKFAPALKMETSTFRRKMQKSDD